MSRSNHKNLSTWLEKAIGTLNSFIFLGFVNCKSRARQRIDSRIVQNNLRISLCISREVGKLIRLNGRNRLSDQGFACPYASTCPDPLIDFVYSR